MKRSMVVLAAALMAAFNLAPLRAAAMGTADQASSSAAAAALAPAPDQNKAPTVVGAASPKDKAGRRKSKVVPPTTPAPKPSPPESAAQLPEKAPDSNPCVATALTSCISERIAGEVQCDAACAARVRKNLADLTPALAKPVPQGADRKLIEPAQRCLGVGGGRKPDNAACGRLLAAERDRQPQADGVVLPGPAQQAPKVSPPVGLVARDWAQLGLLFANLLISALILVLLGRRRRMKPSPTVEAAPIESSAGAPELDVNDSGRNVSTDADGPIGNVLGAPVQNPPLGVEEPGEIFEGDYPEEGPSDLQSALRIDQGNFSELTEIKRQYQEHLVIRGISVPETVLDWFCILQLVHRNLDYDKVPPEGFQEQLSSTVSKIDPEYRLFWEEIAAPSVISEDWYETINQEPRGSGSARLVRVDTPGLKRGGHPIIRAKIRVKYGMKP